MPSSIKMFKATNVIGNDKSAKIDTFVVEELFANEEKSNEVNEEVIQQQVINTEEIIETQMKIAKQKAQDLISQAENKRQKLIDETFKEIEVLKKTAYEEAYEKGNKEGLEKGNQEGYQKGFLEGQAQAQLDNEIEVKKINQMHEEALIKIENFKVDKKKEIIKLASHMAEKIVHKEIDESDLGILELAKPYFYKIDRDEELVYITVHPNQLDYVTKQLPEIEKIAYGTRFMLFADPELEEKGVMIESSKIVIDLQIKKQIQSMLQEFDEMERTVDA